MHPTQVHTYGNLAETALYEEPSSTKKLPLGTYFDDGAQRYRYTHVKDLITRGLLYGQKQSASPSSGLSGYFLAGASHTKSVVAGFGGRIGDTVVKVFSAKSLGSAATGSFEDGYLFCQSGTGEGAGCYRITDYETGATGKATKVFLGRPLAHKLSTDSIIRILTNPYAALVQQSTIGGKVVCAIPRGFAQQSAAGATSGYVWLQTRGYGAAFTGDAVSAGNKLVPAACGQVCGMLATSAARGFVGYALHKQVADEFVATDIRLE